MTNVPRRPWVRILGTASAVALACSILLYGRVWLVEFRDLDKTEYGEGPLLAFALRWMEGPPEPAWLSEMPLSLTVYGPVFPWLWQAALTRLPAIDPLLLGRILASGTGVLLVVGTGLVAFRTSGSGSAALLGVLALVSSPIVPQFLAHARVDSLAALLVLGAYAVFSPALGRLVAAAALLAAGSLVKQTAILHAAPLALVAVATCGGSAGVRFGLAVAGFTVILWGPVLLAFQGFFWEAAVKANLNPLSVWHGTDVVYRVVDTPQFVLAAVAAWLLTLHQWRLVLVNRWLVGFLFSLLAGAALSFKVGSSVNYFLDALWLGAIVIGRAAGIHLKAAPAVAHAVALAVACVVAAPQVLATYADGPPSTSSGLRARQIQAVVTPGAAVIADGHLVSQVLRAGGRLIINDPFVFRLMADEDPALEAHVSRAVPSDAIVILDTRLEARLRQDDIKRGWPREFLAGLATERCLELAGPYIYVYRARPGRRCHTTAPP